MGLFDFIGASSPMFMASEKRETPFRIDYDKLAPGVQQAPNWGGPKSPYKANEADIEEREQREAYAHNMMGDLVKKYGADANAITKDPQFKQISMAMSMTPEEVLRLNNRLEQDTKTKETLDKAGDDQLNAVDYKTYNKTGIIQSVGDSFNNYLSTPTSRLENYQQAYSDLVSTGTKKDFNAYVDGKIKDLTGESPNDIKNINELITKGNAYFVQHKKAGTNNLQQVQDLAVDMANSMDEKAEEGLKGAYLKEYGVSPDYDDLSPQLKAQYLQSYMNAKPGMNREGAEDALRNDLASKFDQYKQKRIMQAIMPKVKITPDETTLTRGGSWLQDKKDVKELQQIGQIGDWLATTPITNPDGSVSPAAAKPTGHLDGLHINVTDKEGNIVQKTIPGNFDYFTGPQYNYSFGKDGIPIEAMTRPSSEGANDEVYFGGKYQSIDNFKGLKIYKAVGASNLPTASNFTIDDFDGDKLKPSSQWKVKDIQRDLNTGKLQSKGIQHYIDAEVVIPAADIKDYADKIEVENYDDKQSEPLLNSFVHRIVNFGTSEFNNASNGLLNLDKDGNLHMIVKVRTPNAEALNAMDNSSDKGIDKNAYTTLLQGTNMNSSEKKTEQ